MGAIDFIIRQKGTDANDAYTTAVEEAIEEYGNDLYNGTISTTSHLFDITKQYRESKKSKEDFIHDILDRASKRTCYCIEEKAPVKNESKIKSKIEHNFVKGASKWDLYYNVYAGWDDSIFVKALKTKTEAVKYAREYTEKHKVNTSVIMVKILTNQDPVVARVKYKQSSQEKEGTYILFGLAAD
jgi:hypothetical protein